MQLFTTIAGTLLIAGLLFATSMLTTKAGNTTTADTLQREKQQQTLVQTLRQMIPFMEFARVLDTVYVLGDRFIDVDLRLQQLKLRYRSGDSLVIPISTGDASIEGAIATPTGIFSVQAKTPEALSRQFGNTKMLWWIGFNYNVGFHGLEVNGYYRHLGKRPSSHGCVRTGREDVKKLYDLVGTGTPVIVYDREPARILAFADTATFDTTSAFVLGSRTRLLAQRMDERLRLLYNGRRFVEQAFSLYVSPGVQLRPGGYATGERDSLLHSQVRPSTIVAQSRSQSQSQSLKSVQDNCVPPLPRPRLLSTTSGTMNIARQTPDTLLAAQPTPKRRRRH
jgi:L,D-transpeptidase catalytic domain